MADLETLHCKRGDHEWNRPKKRGKKPTNCPDHTPVKEVLDPEERIRRQQEGRRIKQEAKDKLGIEQVIAYRAWVKDDAAAFGRFRDGEIDRATYLKIKPEMPVLPDKAAYDAARRVGLAAAEAPAPLIDDDDE
jgi:hypothetical protein